MAHATPTALRGGTPVDADPRRFTYRDLLEMERLGIIGEDERVELLDGRIYRMTIKPPHAWAVSALTRNFVVAFDDRATVATNRVGRHRRVGYVRKFAMDLRFVLLPRQIVQRLRVAGH